MLRNIQIGAKPRIRLCSHMSHPVADHYSTGNLLDAIREGLTQLGLTPETVTMDDLAPVDEFHIGGRQATAAFMEQLVPSETHHLLDIGCGLGGTARYVASTYGSRVTGIDVTADFVETGNELCRWLGLDHRIDLLRGSALAMPFSDEVFDGGYLLHVGMNIEDKRTLCREIHRVLRPGALLGLYDIVKAGDGPLVYPIPWASNTTLSHLASADEYVAALVDAGFHIRAQRNRRDFAIGFFNRLQAKIANAKAGPPLGLHLLMGPSTKAKLENMIAGLIGGALAPMEFIAQKR